MKNNIKLLTLTLSTTLFVACQSGTKTSNVNQNLIQLQVVQAQHVMV